MKHHTKIPSDEDFARAKQRMKERSEKESKFKAAILSELSGKQPCHDIWVWLSENECTVSYIYPTNENLQNNKSEEIEQAIKTSAKNQGIDNVTIEYHSHEHVLKEYNGNYNKYFR